MKSPAELAGVPPFDIEQAKDWYWRLHWGTPVDRMLTLLRPAGAPEVLTEIGQLVQFEIERKGEVGPRRVLLDRTRFFGEEARVSLATDQQGKGLWLLSAGGVALYPNWRPARIVAVTYRTNKAGEDADWRHEFEGAKPQLVADKNGHAIIRRDRSRYFVSWRGIEG
ncbi:MAG: hypothetical protein KC620_13605 [Myxococcales bacterium]|nr:hypothetical protein [Myxococcales bacterium]